MKCRFSEVIPGIVALVGLLCPSTGRAAAGVFTPSTTQETREAHPTPAPPAKRETTAAAPAPARPAEIEGEDVVPASVPPDGPTGRATGSASARTGKTPWPGVAGMSFVLIAPGSFLMGSNSPEAGRDERPPHRVVLRRAFSLATTEVTQAQWKAVMGSNPSRFEGDDLPVENVSWNDCQEFLRKLNERDPGKGYRLPTEAEWEYACRAGLPEDNCGELASVAWYDHSPKTTGHCEESVVDGRTHPVGRKQANAWGLFDMLGNVYEWCADWKGNYPDRPVTDPRGPSRGLCRVVRGGSWYVHANRTKAWFRDAFTPECRRFDIGFRLAADAAAAPPR